VNVGEFAKLSRIEENLRQVRQRIAAAAERAGRDPAEVTLVAVTKGQPPEVVVAGYHLGLRHFGENRVHEALEKMPQVAALLSQQAGESGPPQITWHMIGHLQRRKARDAVRHFDLIHSVDTVRLGREINKRCQAIGRVMPILLEVNVSGETTKFGFQPDEVTAAVPQILELPHVRVIGLMTMAPIVEDPEEARPCFRHLRQLRDELARRFPEADWRHLSMGMTDDFEPAVEEGATMVRIGRAIFGERHTRG
jgi:hypothetical protein